MKSIINEYTYHPSLFLIYLDKILDLKKKYFGLIPCSTKWFSSLSETEKNCENKKIIYYTQLKLFWIEENLFGKGIDPDISDKKEKFVIELNNLKNNQNKTSAQIDFLKKSQYRLGETLNPNILTQKIANHTTRLTRLIGGKKTVKNKLLKSQIKRLLQNQQLLKNQLKRLLQNQQLLKNQLKRLLQNQQLQRNLLKKQLKNKYFFISYIKFINIII